MRWCRYDKPAPAILLVSHEVIETGRIFIGISHKLAQQISSKRTFAALAEYWLNFAALSA
jgi:hypothetical protein